MERRRTAAKIVRSKIPLLFLQKDKQQVLQRSHQKKRSMGIKTVYSSMVQTFRERSFTVYYLKIHGEGTIC